MTGSAVPTVQCSRCAGSGIVVVVVRHPLAVAPVSNLTALNRPCPDCDGSGAVPRLIQPGWEIAWQVEIDTWCRRVLAARFPGAIQYGDARERRDYGSVDLLIFGFP